MRSTRWLSRGITLVLCHSLAHVYHPLDTAAHYALHLTCHSSRVLHTAEVFISSLVPIKFSKNATMLISMRVTEALRTKGASTSRVHGYSSHTSFWLCLLPPRPRNSVAPNSFTSYFVLRTSYLIPSSFSSAMMLSLYFRRLLSRGGRVFWGRWGEKFYHIDMFCACRSGGNMSY